MESNKRNEDLQYYEISDLIGQGQYGDVYKAKDKKSK
jgi:serine/threonine protein kinase